jgi:ApbE superfamily uncharacterized protein (UPF0280 family)
MYEERVYRSVVRPDDLLCYPVVIKETDLYCCTGTDLRTFIEDRVFFYRRQLEEYIEARPIFRESLSPIEYDPFAPSIVRKMIEASDLVNVGPMATVAGAIAEFVGEDIASLCDDFIIENGGDIFLRTGRERTVLLYGKDSPYSGRIGIRLKGRSRPYGVCTSSGTVGHSLSFGRADAVCVVGPSALFADGLATMLGNIVKKKDDIAAAIEKGKVFSDVQGIAIILGDKLGVWGDLELVRV